MKKEFWEGAYRAAGKAALGIHYGKPVYTIGAAEDRKKALMEFASETWIEIYKDNKWSRLL